MPWLLVSPGHLQAWYWICRINRSLSSMGRISITCAISGLGNDGKCNYNFIENQFSTPRVNTLRPRQNGCHFADAIFKCIFLNENVWIPIEILLKFVPKELINNIPALVHIMAWSRPGDKPLSESMMVSLLTHVCFTRPHWVNICILHLIPCTWEQWLCFNSSPPWQNGRHTTDKIFRCIFLNEKFCIMVKISLKFVPKGPIDNKSALAQVMAWRRTGNKPLPEPMHKTRH